MGFNNFATNSGNDNPNNSNGPIGSSAGTLGFTQGGYDPLDFLIDYNKKFKAAQPVLFRDDVIYKTMAILIGKTKPNPLLIGPAGVGKTAIVEDIARRLANNDQTIPDKLKGYTIYELPLSAIVAGSGIVGQLEEKIQTVVDFINNPKNKAIVFIDEIHQLAGKSQTYEKIAQILKPALARGEMHCIGATTTQEVKDLMDDPAFNRRFSRRIVEELSKAQTVEILTNMKGSFFSHYSNRILLDTAVCETTVALADTYRAAGSHRPDNAITLLDRACGEAIINRKKAELAAQAAGDMALLQALQSVPAIRLSEKQLKQTAISLMTGDAKCDDLDEDVLNNKLADIKGQEDVLSEIKDSLIRYSLHLYPQEKPLTFLFAGTSGVGKTEVAKIIAETLTGIKPITLNMTEYHSPASINRIIGSPAGYIGSDSHAELPFDILESNPYQVILLDEFEKGDKAVQRLFMSAFDEGFIKTSRGAIIDFSKSIIIATTNAGHKEIKNTLGFGNSSSDSKPSRATIIKELSAWFDTELLNRFKYIHTFNELSEDIYREIIMNKYHKEIERIKADHRRFSFPDNIPDADMDEIVKKTYVPAFGARPASKAVQDYIEDMAITQKNAVSALPAGNTTASTSDASADVDNLDVADDNPVKDDLTDD